VEFANACVRFVEIHVIVKRINERANAGFAAE
jgi:hypothetical protein